MSWWHWLVVHLSQETGTSNSASRAYDFWSGFGSDIGEATLFTAAIGIYRAHNCHTHRCWRLAKHPVEGTPYKVCRHCHPLMGKDHRPTREHIHRAHERTNR